MCVCVCILETRNREPSQRTHIAVSFTTCLSLWPLGADRFIVSGCLPAKKTFNTFYLHRCRHAMLTLNVFCRSAVAFTAQRCMWPKIPKWTTSKYLRHWIIWSGQHSDLSSALHIQKWSSVIILCASHFDGKSGCFCNLGLQFWPYSFAMCPRDWRENMWEDKKTLLCETCW